MSQNSTEFLILRCFFIAHSDCNKYFYTILPFVWSEWWFFRCWMFKVFMKKHRISKQSSGMLYVFPVRLWIFKNTIFFILIQQTFLQRAVWIKKKNSNETENKMKKTSQNLSIATRSNIWIIVVSLFEL